MEIKSAFNLIGVEEAVSNYHIHNVYDREKSSNQAIIYNGRGPQCDDAEAKSVPST